MGSQKIRIFIEEFDIFARLNELLVKAIYTSQYNRLSSVSDRDSTLLHTQHNVLVKEKERQVVLVKEATGERIREADWQPEIIKVSKDQYATY